MIASFFVLRFSLFAQAVYADDVTPNNAAYADFVLTTVATGEIVSVDPSAALQLPGVIAWISAKDIQPGTTHLPTLNTFTYTLTTRHTHDIHTTQTATPSRPTRSRLSGTSPCLLTRRSSTTASPSVCAYSRPQWA